MRKTMFSMRVDKNYVDKQDSIGERGVHEMVTILKIKGLLSKIVNQGGKGEGVKYPKIQST